ncbi:MAG: class I SAM-dependent methyltransferase [Anaerolineales bacterium]
MMRLSYNSDVNPTTISRLLDLNRQFYQTFALPFSSTRLRLQPGVQRILESISPTENLLDLGCGNGELARRLVKNGYKGNYTGLDFSSALLEQAKTGLPSNFRFLQADLSAKDWDAPVSANHYATILAFAVLHHLPGEDLRFQVLSKVRSLLSPGGRFTHSEWLFLNSPRLVARIQPWEAIGLSAIDVDPGDYLLDWRQGGTGLRYVHHFSEHELAQLAEATSFEITGSFLSDGKNGRLGLYQVWRAKENPSAEAKSSL